MDVREKKNCDFFKYIHDLKLNSSLLSNQVISECRFIKFIGFSKPIYASLYLIGSLNIIKKTRAKKFVPRAAAPHSAVG